MNALALDLLTEPQRAKFAALQERFTDLTGPFPTVGCDGAVMARAGGLWIGIETDGYSHT